MRVFDNILKVSCLTALSACLLTGCKEEYIRYSDAEYVMFADTMSVNTVLQGQEEFKVPVASTVACDYDRTLGVEIVDEGSTAVEGLHYRLASNTVTIKAGELSSDVVVDAICDNMDVYDTLQFNLRLVMPEKYTSSIYGDMTKVKLYKTCPFMLEQFTGWCVVTSLFLYSYPGLDGTTFQRLIYTEAVPGENTVILRDFLFDGYDVTISFDASDPADPQVVMDEVQVISDEFSVFGQVVGDDRILAVASPYYISSFNPCDNSVDLWIHAYVNKLGTPVGTVGHYENVLEWVSDAEAERLYKEEGMKPYKYPKQ